jgi:hypothetical protein
VGRGGEVGSWYYAINSQSYRRRQRKIVVGVTSSPGSPETSRWISMTQAAGSGFSSAIGTPSSLPPSTPSSPLPGLMWSRHGACAPGAQLDLFEERDGWRYTAFATDTPARQLAHLDARHRAYARVEDHRIVRYEVARVE